jgi:hypothetical protein
MKSITKFIPVTEPLLKSLQEQLKGEISETEWNDFNEYVRPYKKLGSEQLDDIFLIAEVTIRYNGTITEIKPHCSIDQEDWPSFWDEPDIAINSIDIPFKMLLPKGPLKIKGSETFTVVLMAEGNIWDSCKDLPDHVWSERSFEFMLSTVITAENGKQCYGNEGDEYANQLIKW